MRPLSVELHLSSRGNRRFESALHVFHILRVAVGMQHDHEHLPFAEGRIRESRCINSISFGVGLEHIRRGSGSGFVRRWFDAL